MLDSVFLDFWLSQAHCFHSVRGRSHRDSLLEVWSLRNAKDKARFGEKHPVMSVKVSCMQAQSSYVNNGKCGATPPGPVTLDTFKKKKNATCSEEWSTHPTHVPL